MKKTAAQEAFWRHQEKYAREFVTTEGIPVGPTLTEYADKVRNFELGGAGLGAAGGGALIGRLSKGKLPGIAMGILGGGLLGKGLGRHAGEELGMRELEAQTGLPIGRDPMAAIVQP